MMDKIIHPQSAGNEVGEEMSTYKNCRVINGMVHLDVMNNGVRFRKSTGRRATKAELKYVEKNWRSEYDRLTDKADTDLKKMVQHEIMFEAYGYDSLEANRTSRRELTNKEYFGIFKTRIAPYFQDVPLSSIVQSDIRKWQAKLLEAGRSTKRIHNIRTVFQGIMNDAYADGLIDRNPFMGLKGMNQSRAEDDIAPFTLDEIKTILSNTDGWFKNFLTLAFFTGMRTGEMLALRWEDVDFENNKIKISRSIRSGVISDPKTKSSIRSIDMLHMVAEALKSQQKLSAAKENVFVNKHGAGYKDSSAIRDRYWYALLKELKIKKRVQYQTRHTFATMMISRNEDMTWVSNMLGHANVAITLTFYTKYREEKNVKRASFLDEFKVEAA